MSATTRQITVYFTAPACIYTIVTDSGGNQIERTRTHDNFLAFILYKVV